MKKTSRVIPAAAIIRMPTAVAADIKKDKD